MKRGELMGIIKNGCVIFTVITLATYTLGMILSTADKVLIPTLQHIWLFFVFSVLLSGANTLLRQTRLSLALRFVLHAIAATVLFIVTVLFCGGLYKKSGVALIATFIFLLFYIIFAVCYSLFIRQKERKLEKNVQKKYTSMFE